MKGLIIVLAVFTASIEPIIIKIGYNNFKNLNPLEIIVVKNLISFVIFSGITLFKYFITKNFKILKLNDILLVLRVSILLLFTTSMTIISLNFIPAIIMLTIYSITPLFVALTNSLIKKTETIGFKFFVGFILAFIGVSLTIGLYDLLFNLNGEINFLGIFLAFLGVLSSTIYRTTLDYLTHKYTPFVVSNYIFLINGLVILLFVFPFIFNHLKLGSVLVGIYGGISGSIANIAFLYALNVLGSTNVSLLNMLNQPTVILLSAIILKEKLTIYQIIGIFLTILGIAIAKNKK